MSYHGRIKHLEETHRVLDKKIDGLESTGKFEDGELVRLKKHRLIIRDELNRLRREQHEAAQTVTFEDDR